MPRGGITHWKYVTIPIKFIYDPEGFDRILCVDKKGVDNLELLRK